MDSNRNILAAYRRRKRVCRHRKPTNRQKRIRKLPRTQPCKTYYKGFRVNDDGQLYCRGMVFQDAAPGKRYSVPKLDRRIVAGQYGLHACKHLADVFKFYPPKNNPCTQYWKVKLEGDVQRHDRIFAAQTIEFVKPVTTTVVLANGHYHFRNGYLHDPKLGRPAVVMYRRDGTTECKQYYTNGKLQNPETGKPAVVYYYPNGKVQREEYYTAGIRQDPAIGKPAVVVYYPNGKVQREEYYTEDIRQDPTTGKPAVVVYYENTNVKLEEHYIRGIRQDPVTGDPAIVEYFSHGKVECAHYYTNGIRSRSTHSMFGTYHVQTVRNT